MGMPSPTSIGIFSRVLRAKPTARPYRGYTSMNFLQNPPKTPTSMAQLKSYGGPMKLLTYKILLSMLFTSCLYFPEEPKFVQAGNHIRAIASELAASAFGAPQK